MRKLNAKQNRFVAEYLVDMVAGKAALRAGYSKNNAEWIGPQLLKKPHVAKAVADKIEERNKCTGVDAQWVLKRLLQIDDMDVKDILDDNGTCLPVKCWPKVWRQFISGMDVSEVWNGFGDDKQQAGFLKKMKWPDKVKNLELIGKHVNVQAFKEQIANTHELDIAKSIKGVFEEVDGSSWGLPKK